MRKEVGEGPIATDLSRLIVAENLYLSPVFAAARITVLLSYFPTVLRSYCLTVLLEYPQGLTGVVHFC